MQKNVLYCTKTHEGLKKLSNEDSFVVIDNISIKSASQDSAAVLFAVADGVSSHIGGEKASNMAVSFLKKHFGNHQKNEFLAGQRERKLKALEHMVFEIHEKISQASDKVEKYKYMGTTLSLLLIHKMSALIAHVGDSRIYRLRNGKLIKLTHDDTIAQLSMEMGYMSAEGAETHPLRHALIQALGQGVDMVQVRFEELRAGDIFLLCTDGLYEMVPEKEIKDLLEAGVMANQVCESLVYRALGGGGSDNITVIVVQIL